MSVTIPIVSGRGSDRANGRLDSTRIESNRIESNERHPLVKQPDAWPPLARFVRLQEAECLLLERGNILRW